MNRKYMFIAAMLLSILLASMGLTTLYMNLSTGQEKNDDFVIVTSFYPMYIAALNVADGIEGVQVVNLSEPQTGCLHDFTLTPKDMQLLSRADVFVINGGGIESFMESVAETYPKLQIIDASEGIDLIAEDDEENAHAWMSIASHCMQVENITDGLAKSDSRHEMQYKNNADNYEKKLQSLLEKQEEITKHMAENTDVASVILFHEAYAYVAKDLGLEVAYVLDLDEERAVSAGEVADVLDAIETKQISYIFAEETYGGKIGQTVEAESDVTVIYLDPLNRGNYDKDSYLTGMQSNLEKISMMGSE